MIQPRAGTIEVPRIHRYVELFDLLPPATCRRRAAKAGCVAQIVKPGRVNVVERKLL